MLRWSKVMPRLQVQCKRSPSDEFRDMRLGTAQDMLGSVATNRTVGCIKNPEIEARNARIRERYANGESQKAIGNDYGLSRETISKICKGVERKAGIARIGAQKIEARNARIRERYANGETQNKIANEEGLSLIHVYRICRGIGREVKSKEERNARIRERYADGETQKAIGNDYGLTHYGVSRICKGVERKDGYTRLCGPEAEARNAKIRERFANGETQAAIGEDYGLSRTGVCSVILRSERKVSTGKLMAKNLEMEKRNADIRERFANGETQAAIGEDYGLSRYRVGIICKGVERKAEYRRSSGSEIEARNAKIRERFANGETQTVIGKDYGLTRETVGIICKGVERKVKPTIARNPEIEKRDALIRERFANGATGKRIAREEGLSIDYVFTICRGVERKAGKCLKGSAAQKRNAGMRERFANGETSGALGKDYGLSQDRILSICKGVERKVKPPRKPRDNITEMEKRDAKIRERYDNGETGKRIAREERLTRDYVYEICKGIRRKNGLAKRAGRKKNT